MTSNPRLVLPLLIATQTALVCVTLIACFAPSVRVWWILFPLLLSVLFLLLFGAHSAPQRGRGSEF